MSLQPEEEKINFYSEDIEFNLPNHSTIFDWINLAIQNEAKVLRYLNFIFCSDTYLHKINVEYLNHDTFTDVITFPYAEGKNIEGDIFISIDRIKENAKDSYRELEVNKLKGVKNLTRKKLLRMSQLQNRFYSFDFL